MDVSVLFFVSKRHLVGNVWITTACDVFCNAYFAGLYIILIF